MSMRRATDQRTFVSVRAIPEPMTEPEATCVVDSGSPRWLEVRMIDALEKSADMPCRGEMSTMPLPRVRMTRQPPM